MSESVCVGVGEGMAERLKGRSRVKQRGPEETKRW